MNPILEWALTIIGSGGIGAVITYIFTFKSKQKQANAEAEKAEIEAEHDHFELRQDQYDYLQKTCDKYIKEYYDLEGDFRKQIIDLREKMDALMNEKSQAIAAKCTEIATLKSQIAYLKGIRCYRFDCPNRIKINPDKSEE
jgi:hypothetical protein